jgi:hypothetical protein
MFRGVFNENELKDMHSVLRSRNEMVKTYSLVTEPDPASRVEFPGATRTPGDIISIRWDERHFKQ